MENYFDDEGDTAVQAAYDAVSTNCRIATAFNAHPVAPGTSNVVRNAPIYNSPDAESRFRPPFDYAPHPASNVPRPVSTTYNAPHPVNNVSCPVSTTRYVPYNVPRSVSTTHAPYNVPHANEVSRPTNRSIRLLGRRYELTYGGYKYLEIGIKVASPTSAIEVVIGDSRGHEIAFDVDAWNNLINQRSAIISFFDDLRVRRADVDVKRNISGLGEVSLKTGKMGNRKVLMIATDDVRISITYPTLRYMLALAPCVAHEIKLLLGHVDIVSNRFATLREIAATAPDAASVPEVIRDSRYFDSNSLVDCELLAVIFERDVIVRKNG